MFLCRDQLRCSSLKPRTPRNWSRFRSRERDVRNADGYAYVGFFINGSLYWSRTYLVKFGIVLPVEEVAAIECRLPDRCFDWGHVSDLRLVWTIRALFAS